MTKVLQKRIMWAGWFLAVTIGGSVCVWFSKSVDANTEQVVENAKHIAVVKERQRTQYLQLREDIAEVKELVK